MKKSKSRLVQFYAVLRKYPWISVLSLISILFHVPIVHSEPELRQYYIACDPDSLDYILENFEEDIYIHCEFVYEGNVWHDAKIRLRGDSSRGFPKKSYKVNFQSSERFDGRDKVNLVSEYLDYSYCHEYLSYDLFHRVGLDASKCWFAEVYINQQYMGLYLDVEQVDEQFLSRTDLDNYSSLYKASLDGSMLRQAEKLDSLWEKKTNEITGFYDFEKLVEWIHNTPPSSFYLELGQVFDREQLARHMALNTLITNSSTYYHNYYLVHDLSPGGKWSILPWDMDRSFRSWGTAFSQPEYYISSHGTMEGTNPFVEKCWRDPQMRELIYQHTIQIADSFITEEYYEPLVKELNQLLSEAVIADTFKRGTVEQFYSDLLSRPAAIIGRANHMRGAIGNAPRPFNINEIFPLRNGVLITWDTTESGDSSPVTYQVRVDDSYLISEPTLYNAGNDTFIVIDDLAPGEYYFDVEATNQSEYLTTSMSFYRSFRIPENYGSDVSGILSHSTVWYKANSPFRVTDDLVLTEGTNLTIEAGVEIIIENRASILINGELEIIGTEEDSVVFSGDLQQKDCGRIHVDGPDAILQAEYIKTNSIDLYSEPLFLITNEASLTVDRSNIDIKSGSGIVGNKAFINIGNTQITSRNEEAVWTDESNIKIFDSRFVALENDSMNKLISLNNSINVTLAKSEFSGNTGEELIYFGFSDSLYVYNCIFSGNTNGMMLQDMDCVRVENCLFTDLDTAIVLIESNMIDVFNSVFSKNENIIHYQEEYDTDIRKFTNCIFYENQLNVADPELDVDVTYSLIEDSSYLITGGKYGDPVVVDAWNNNWTPFINSPLIDAGYAVNFPRLDFLGNERFDIYEVMNSGMGDISYVDIGLIELIGNLVIDPADGLDEDLLAIYPNPGSDQFSISTFQNYVGRIRLTVYNVLGQKVYSESKIQKSLGKHVFIWDAKNRYGNKSASGIYFVTVETKTKKLRKKLIILN